MDHPVAQAVDYGVALSEQEVVWVEKQMCTPDAHDKNRKYYLFFPAKDFSGIFRIGVTNNDTPVGPFAYKGRILNPVVR